MLSRGVAALQRMWRDSQLSDATPDEGSAAPAFDPPNLLRPTFGPEKPVLESATNRRAAGRAHGTPPAEPPDLLGALDALTRVAEFIRAAEERAAAAEQQLRALRDESADRARRAEGEIDALRERVRVAESALQFVTSRTEEALSHADAEILAHREEARSETERARSIELRLTEQLSAAETRLRAADQRARAAAARAPAARRDHAPPAETIHERFSTIAADGSAWIGSPREAEQPGLGSLLPKVA